MSDPTSDVGVSCFRSEPQPGTEKIQPVRKKPVYKKAGDTGGGPGSTNAILVKESYSILKRDHQSIDLGKGPWVVKYEKIGAGIQGKLVFRRSSRSKQRSSSVPAGSDNKTTMVGGEEIGKLEKAFDLFNEIMIN